MDGLVVDQCIYIYTGMPPLKRSPCQIMNSACGEALPNRRRARLQSRHICTPTENDLTGHLCKQPQFHFKIRSYRLAEQNIFATPFAPVLHPLNPDHQKNKQDIKPPNSKLSSRTSFFVFRGVSRTSFHASGDSCIPAVSGVKD